MKLRRTSRRVLSVLAAVAAGMVGVFVLATPASAHFGDIVPILNCVTGTSDSTVTFRVSSHYHFDHLSMTVEGSGTLTNPGGSVSQAELGVADDYTLSQPVYNYSGLKIFDTTPVTLSAGQQLSVSFTLKWYRSSNLNYPVAVDRVSTSVTGSPNCQPPANRTVDFIDNCDNIQISFASNRNDYFKIVYRDGVSQRSPAAQMSWTLTVDPSKAPLTAYYKKGGTWEKLGDHSYSPPNCAPPTLTVESTCDGLRVLLENPSNGKNDSVTVTFTDDEGSTRDLVAARGGTDEYTFPGRPGLNVSYTPLGGGDTITVVWAPAGCATPPPTSTTPSLPNTGSSGLTGIVAAGSALVLAGAGLLLFVGRRRTAAGG